MSKKIKELSMKWYTWLIVTTLFLVVVQILFTIPAPCKWLDAVWEAGDLISFVGTIVLGYIAVTQTRQANETAKSANETSQKLIELQNSEYTPTLLLENFVGITKHTITHGDKRLNSGISIIEGRTEDNEVIFGLAISIVDYIYEEEKPLYCRDYEIHIKYEGRILVKNIILESIQFDANEFSKKFEINESLEMSLANGQDFRLYLFHISNENHLQDETDANKCISAPNMRMIFEIETVGGKIYKQEMRILKHLIIEPEKRFNMEKIEVPVTVSYEVLTSEEQEGDYTNG